MMTTPVRFIAVALFTLAAAIGSAAESDHWAFRPPRHQPIPSVRRADWPQTPVDNFILARLEAAGLAPSPPADKRTLIRRAYFDLIGLPPTFEQVQAFVADESPRAYENMIDNLLASPRY